MDIWYNIAKSIVGCYNTLFMRIHVSGAEHIPPGRKIIVGNHPNATDSFALPFIFKEKLIYAIQADVFQVPLIGKILARAGQIPVQKGCGMEMLQIARRNIERGLPVVIFPEGRLNFGGDLKRGNLGAALLAEQTGAPVLPIGFYTPPKYIRVIRKHMHNRETIAGWQMGGAIYVNIGQPMRLPQKRQQQLRSCMLRDFTDQMMDTITHLMDEIKLGTA
jgi:1-acyl-sn-glycerol-3-phosphate acyltransferase